MAITGPEWARATTRVRSCDFHTYTSPLTAPVKVTSSYMYAQGEGWEEEQSCKSTCNHWTHCYIWSLISIWKNAKDPSPLLDGASVPSRTFRGHGKIIHTWSIAHMEHRDSIIPIIHKTWCDVTTGWMAGGQRGISDHSLIKPASLHHEVCVSAIDFKGINQRPIPRK